MNCSWGGDAPLRGPLLSSQVLLCLFPSCQTLFSLSLLLSLPPGSSPQASAIGRHLCIVDLASFSLVSWCICLSSLQQCCRRTHSSFSLFLSQLSSTSLPTYISGSSPVLSVSPCLFLSSSLQLEDIPFYYVNVCLQWTLVYPSTVIQDSLGSPLDTDHLSQHCLPSSVCATDIYH